MSIEVSGLTRQYGEQKAVNQASFTIAKGEVVGFLGPNGAGKSTTLKILTGYLRADGGTAKICGLDVASHPLAIKRKIGYLPEANPLYPDMYVREFLGFVAGVHQISQPKQAIDKVISLTGLTLEAQKKIAQLSKGYKQRVGLAAALIHSPEVLMLDEPTSGLDPNQIIEIRNVIKEQGKEKTVLFSSHILQEVEAICDRVIIINKGNIVADDRLASLRMTNQKVQSVLVQFGEKIALSLLQSLPGIEKVAELPGSVYRLSCAQPDWVRKELLQLAIGQNLNIVSLQTEGSSLEEIFRSLTKTMPA